MFSMSGVVRLGDDPRLSDGETTVCFFPAAVNVFNMGEKETVWINCVAFGRIAEVIADYAKKGDQLGVHGELTGIKSGYEDADGEWVDLENPQIELKVWGVDLVSSGDGDGGGESRQSSSRGSKRGGSNRGRSGGSSKRGGGSKRSGNRRYSGDEF